MSHRKPTRRGAGRGRVNGRVTVLAVVLALLGAGCTHAAPPATQEVAVSPAHAATLQLPSGPTVDVPSGAVAGAGHVSGRSVASPGPAPAGLVATGSVWQLEVDGTSLTGEVTLHFPAPAVQTDEPPSAFLAYYDPGSKSWQPVATTFDAASTTLVASSTHLSLWSAFRFDTGALVRAIGGLLNSIVGRGDRVGNPVCDGASTVSTARISVTSSSGNAVKWCVGDVGGAPQLKVLDNHGTAVAIRYPSSWQAQDIGGADPVVDAAVNLVSRYAEFPPAGQAVKVVSPGRGVTLTAPVGASGTVSVAPSSEAYLLTALVFAAETLAMTWGDLPWFGTHADPTKTAEAVTAVASSADCLQRLDALAKADVSTAAGVGSVFRETAKLAVGCLGDQWKQAYGVTAWWASAALAVVFWLVDGVKLALAGVGALIDTSLYLQGYEIHLTQRTAQVPVATDTSFGPVSLGMTVQQVVAATGASPSDLNANCTDIAYQVDGARGPAGATIHHPSDPSEPAQPGDDHVLVIDTPAGTKTDRGVGDGSRVAEVENAYPDRRSDVINTQAGLSLVVTTGDPSEVGSPGAFGDEVLGFQVQDDGTVGPPLIGGVPGFEYCSG